MYDSVLIEPFSENKSWESIRVDPKTAFEPYPNPKHSRLGPQKAKNDPKIRPTINVRIQGNIENKSYSAIQVDPKNVLQPHTNPKNITLGPPKAQKKLKLGQN